MFVRNMAIRTVTCPDKLLMPAWLMKAISSKVVGILILHLRFTLALITLTMTAITCTFTVYKLIHYTLYKSVHFSCKQLKHLFPNNDQTIIIAMAVMRIKKQRSEPKWSIHIIAPKAWQIYLARTMHCFIGADRIPSMNCWK